MKIQWNAGIFMVSYRRNVKLFFRDMEMAVIQQSGQGINRSKYMQSKKWDCYKSLGSWKHKKNQREKV